jgi:chromodomain-helicase-DNA-binding protein 1
VEGAEPRPGDPWATRAFLIKWRFYSHLHCTWETRPTLQQLAGYKRVLNYMRKVRAELS